jgi:hypothetical protein
LVEASRPTIQDVVGPVPIDGVIEDTSDGILDAAQRVCYPVGIRRNLPGQIDQHLLWRIGVRHRIVSGVATYILGSYASNDKVITISHVDGSGDHAS